MKLEDKVAIVTGGGSGIGHGISELFASEGAKVAVADINKDNAQGVVEQINANGGVAMAVEVDVANGDSVRAMAAAVAGAFGGIDVLVNNAGSRCIKTFLDHSEDDWHKMIGINLTAHFLCGQAVVPHMIAVGGGKIVNVASIAGHVGRPDRVAYCAAKGGVLAFTRAFATDMSGKNIFVNSISPGSIHTAMNASYAEDDAVDWGGETLIKRWGQPNDVASAALFLASEASTFITGIDVRVDGGWLSGRARDGESIGA
jgi:NAD(P)-dependent dehydrogenase (short-subunit alcohol dehydrogenase family)